MNFEIRNWVRFSLASLSIVAILGVLMRYKIGFDFPYFSQKNIQHAHSHFAFLGWVTQTLYVLLVRYITRNTTTSYLSHYKTILTSNLVCATGILVSFFIEGYGVVSISLSTFSIVLAGFFAYYFLKDLKRIPADNPGKPWFKAAIWFHLFSSIGTFYLAYIMASHNFHEYWYLASVYFYLHFQYNGFFIFACIGFAVTKAPQLLPTYKYNKVIFRLFFISAIPAYFLSVLWANLPIWLYVIVVVAAIAQLLGWIKLVADLQKAFHEKNLLTPYLKYLFLFVFIAFSIKLILQLGSTIPVVSKMAFGFRPVVIAYLHLVLLAVITVFLLTYLYWLEAIKGRAARAALAVFTIGVFLNEAALAVQGAASFIYLPVEYINEILFGIAIILAFGAIWLALSQITRKEVPSSGL